MIRFRVQPIEQFHQAGMCGHGLMCPNRITAKDILGCVAACEILVYGDRVGKNGREKAFYHDQIFVALHVFQFFRQTEQGKLAHHSGLKQIKVV